MNFILPTVVHCKKSKFDVYIGRGKGSIWGNPFSHLPSSAAQFRVETRDEAIEKYKDWILTQDTLLDKLWTLEGKVLGCWCSPLRCHGEVLVALCNERFNLPPT